MNVDLMKVFSYPLTPVPLCLAPVNGMRHSTAKSKLTKKLESKTKTEGPENVDTSIIDAMYFIRAMDVKALPSTYGGIHMQILRDICKKNSSGFCM